MGISYGAHQPVVRGRHRSAAPGGDRAAVRDRQHRDDAVPRRDPKHRLRGPLGRGRVLDANRRRPTGGQAWRCTGSAGRCTCQANQALHGEAANVVAKIDDNATTSRRWPTPCPRSRSWTRIHVRRCLACQWTDEQTGGHCPELAAHFTGTRPQMVTFTNGYHTDSLDPATFERWYDFLELYVAQRAPCRRGSGPGAHAVYQTALGISGVTLPHDPMKPNRATRPRWPPSSGWRRSGSCSTTAAAARSPAPRVRPSSSRSRASRCPARGPGPGTSAPAAT